MIWFFVISFLQVTIVSPFRSQSTNPSISKDGELSGSCPASLSRPSLPHSLPASWQGEVLPHDNVFFSLHPSCPTFFLMEPGIVLSTGVSAFSSPRPCYSRNWFESSSGGRNIIRDLFRILRRVHVHLWVSSLIARRTLY